MDLLSILFFSLFVDDLRSELLHLLPSELKSTTRPLSTDAIDCCYEVFCLVLSQENLYITWAAEKTIVLTHKLIAPSTHRLY